MYFGHYAGVHAQSPSPTQVPTEPVATVTFGPSRAVTAESSQGVFERVGLWPRQVVDVMVHYGAAKAGQTITAQPLDGGRVITTGSSLVVAADGTIAFKFQAGDQPGTYQVSLRDNAQESGLEFWVFDDAHPEKNPPVKNK